MAKVTFYKVIEVLVYVEADVTPGTEERFSGEVGNWIPGDTPEVTIEKISISRSNRRVDITDITDRSTDELLKESALEELAREGGDAA